jgi:hypothetical protein
VAVAHPLNAAWQFGSTATLDAQAEIRASNNMHALDGHSSRI